MPRDFHAWRGVKWSPTFTPAYIQLRSSGRGHWFLSGLAKDSMMFSLGALVAEGFGPLGTCRSLQVHASLLGLSSIAS